MSPRHDPSLEEAARLLAERCPRLARLCYWAGTSVVAIEELGHRVSFDLDFHTRRALADTRPILAEIEKAFSGRFEVLEPPDELGSGFGGLLHLESGQRVPVQVLANYEDVPDADVVPSRCAPGLSRVSLARYLADKIQCVAERAEARDLFDVDAVLGSHPELARAARERLAEQDGLLLAERLTGWTDDAVREDLRAYADVDPARACRARDLLLSWLRELGDQPLGPDDGEADEEPDTEDEG